MVILLTIIALIFTFYMPYYLKKNANQIEPSQNIFDNFVNNDIGYPWSKDPERKNEYKKSVLEKIKNNSSQS